LGVTPLNPILKKDNQYFLIAGHHRKDALRQTFGEDFEVSVMPCN